jgi:hypothetical protein
MLKKIQRKAAKLTAELSYQLDLLSHARTLPPIFPQDQQIVNALRTEGAFITSLDKLGLSSTSQLLDAANRYLSVMESFVPTEDGIVKGHNGEPIFPQIYTVTDLEEFHAWGAEPRLLNIIENYIGLPVEFQGVHLRRDFANLSPVTTEFWHQDLEDRRIVKIFLYLVDVDERRGPFEYIPRYAVSQFEALRVWFKNWQAKRRGALGLTDDDLNAIVPRSNWKPCPGPAGTVVIADTKHVLHHGRNRQMHRSALFFVYTAKNPKRPECCTQYRDSTFARPNVLASTQSTI